MKAAALATDERLLLTAERLFAQHGIDAVSTRQIAVAAGQRNVGALHYHFGNMDALIDALLALRLRGINRRREALLDQLQADGALDDLHALLRALVQPLLDELEAPDNHFIGCLQQLYIGKRGQKVYASLSPELTSGLDRVNTAIAALLVHVPLAVRNDRLGLMGVQIVYSAAGWYYQRERGEPVSPLPQLTANLIDFLAGGLCAPVSAPLKRKPVPTTRKR
jgi:AcrR family transcriptional regulator